MAHLRKYLLNQIAIGSVALAVNFLLKLIHIPEKTDFDDDGKPDFADPVLVVVASYLPFLVAYLPFLVGHPKFEPLDCSYRMVEHQVVGRRHLVVGRRHLAVGHLAY